MLCILSLINSFMEPMYHRAVKTHFPHRFFSSDSPRFQSLHYSKFGTRYLLFVCHLPPRTFFKFSKIIFYFFFFFVYISISPSPKRFILFLHQFSFPLSFLSWDFKENLVLGYHEMGNIDNVCK